MKTLTNADREKLLLAGEICYEEILRDVQKIESMKSEPVEYDRDRIRRAETEAWREVRRANCAGRIRRVVMVTSCLLLAIVAVMMSGTPSVAYHKLWNNLFVKDDGNYVSIVTNSSAQIPQNWTGCYVPTEVPQEYVIESVERTDTVKSILYINADGNYISFGAVSGEYGAHLDAEDCDIKEIAVGDMSGLLITKYKGEEIIYRCVCWFDEEKYFDLSSDVLSDNTLISIAESVMVVK